MINPSSCKPTKWSNTLKKFVGNSRQNCLSVFDHFVWLAFKGLKVENESPTSSFCCLNFIIQGNRTHFPMIKGYSIHLIKTHTVSSFQRQILLCYAAHETNSSLSTFLGYVFAGLKISRLNNLENLRNYNSTQSSLSLYHDVNDSTFISNVYYNSF